MPMSRSELDESSKPLGWPTSQHSDPTACPVSDPSGTSGRMASCTHHADAARRTAQTSLGSSVAVSVASEDHPYRAVLARGTMKIEEQGRDAWLERIARRYGAFPGWYQDALHEDDASSSAGAGDLVTWDYGKGDHEAMNAGSSLRTTL